MICIQYEADSFQNQASVLVDTMMLLKYNHQVNDLIYSISKWFSNMSNVMGSK